MKMNAPNFVVEFEVSGDPAVHLEVASRLSVRDGKLTLIGLEGGDVRVFDSKNIAIRSLRSLSLPRQVMAA